MKERARLEEDLPLLRTMPAMKQRNRDENHNGFAAVANLDLFEESWCQHKSCPVPTASSYVS